MNSKQTVIIRISIIYALLHLAIACGVLWQGNSQFILNIVGPAIVWLIYTWLEFRYQVFIDLNIRVIAMVATLTDSFFGYYCNYYLTSGTFDKIQHAFGTYAAALVLYLLIRRWLQQIYTPVSAFILVLCLGLSVGAVYEIGEFLGDLLSNPVQKSQPNLLDTDLDLVGDLFGAIVAACHVRYRKY